LVQQQRSTRLQLCSWDRQMVMLFTSEAVEWKKVGEGLKKGEPRVG
jgi:hypothetical protein